MTTLRKGVGGIWSAMQYKTYINCRLPRIKTADGKVETLPVPWARSYNRRTYLFESAVISLLSGNKNQSETARFLDCSFDLVNRIMTEAVERGMARREAESEEVVYENVSIDEKAVGRGHDYATILSEPLSGSVIEVVEERTQEAAQEVIEQGLSRKQQKQVKTISMNMWDGFITAARKHYLPRKLSMTRFTL